MKKRIIPSILLNQGTQVCLSQNFDPWRTVGTLTQSLRLHTKRSCDELFVLNPFISSLRDLNDRFFSLITNEVDVPISYAGGIKSSLDAQLIINNGFDKVFITSSFVDNPNTLSSICSTLGSQSVGVSLPYVICDGDYFLWDYRSKQPTTWLLIEAFQKAIDHGAGEIVLHSVHHDGQLCGFDQSIFSIVDQVSSSIPILLSGGFSSPDNVKNALSHPRINAAVAGALFSLTEHTPKTIRSYCLLNNIPMRQALF